MLRPSDRLAFLLASAAILWITVVIRRLVHPADAIFWTYQVLALCLFVAAIIGRALLPYRPPEEARDLAWQPAAQCAAVALAAVIPYLPGITIGFVSDDFGLAWIARDSRHAAEAMSSTGLIGFYRPLVMLAWWVADRLWAGAPVGHHAVATLVHAANSLLVYGIGRRLIGSSYGALVAGLLFAVHPLHVEPVCWPAAGADLLCAGFSLLSLMLVLSYRSSAAGRARWMSLAGALVAFLLALLSKEAALALPGAIVLLLALTGQRRRREFAVVVGSYVIVLTLYLVWRMRVLGGMGGYAMPVSFWNTYFPSNPLLLIGDFMFPVHRTLFDGLGPLASWLAGIAMAAVALWWLMGLDRVPGPRLWLWTGSVFLLAVPSWTFRWQPSASLEWTRFGYLPTVGLAWLFGDICAGRGCRSRQTAAIAGIVVAGFAALTVWYVTPWRTAGRLARKAVLAGVTLIEQHTTSQGPPTLYVQGLPEAYHGAPVLANCYQQAINLSLGRQSPVKVVTAMPRAGGIHPDVMARWKLRPGEYLAAYDMKAGDLVIVREGARPRSDSGTGGPA